MQVYCILGIDCALGLIISCHGHDKMHGAIMSGVHNHPSQENPPLFVSKDNFHPAARSTGNVIAGDGGNNCPQPTQPLRGMTGILARTLFSR